MEFAIESGNGCTERRNILENKDVNLNFEHFHKVFSLLGQCTEDYLYIYDLVLDEYTISDSAVERFDIPGAKFKNASQNLEKVCYSYDYPMLAGEIDKMRNGKTQEHNLEYRWLNKDRNPVWISCRGQVVKGEDGNPHYLVGRITELGRGNKIDNVTGLYRENAFYVTIDEMKKKGEERGYLLQIGIDNFREINDKFGKHIGDEVLKNTSLCIESCLKDMGTIYRLDGDEMLVYVKNPHVNQRDPASDLYKKIRVKIDESIEANGYKIFYTISAGSVYLDEKSQFDLDYLERAGFALHQAKESGKNTYVRYDESEYQDFVKRVDMQERLRKSVRNDFDGFELYYQPIVNVEKHKILGAEALLRWKDDVVGRVSPIEFIPLLEESGLIIPVGRWVIKTAMKQCLKWQEQDQDFRVNINLSFIQLKKSNVINDIDDCMKELAFNSRNVLFEVTESGELEKGEMTKNILQSFRKRQLNLGIDDFGTGYSNLRYVKEMMFGLVKIDQEFIRNIKESQYDYLVVKQFTELAHSLNLKVCYEGVETREDLECVLEMKPDYIQGFYFARPVPVDEFEDKFLCKIEKF